MHETFKRRKRKLRKVLKDHDPWIEFLSRVYSSNSSKEQLRKHKTNHDFLLGMFAIGNRVHSQRRRYGVFERQMNCASFTYLSRRTKETLLLQTRFFPSVDFLCLPSWEAFFFGSTGEMKCTCRVGWQRCQEILESIQTWRKSFPLVWP